MKKLFIFALCSLPFLSSAQQDYTMRFLPQLQQSQWTNASNETDAKISVGIPVLSSLSFYLYNSGFTYHSLFHKVNDSTTAIHMGDVINKLNDKNYVGFGASVSLLSFNLSRPDFSVGFSVNDKVDMQFSYPKDLFKLLWYGNGSYLGQTLDIGNFGLNASWYREYALHGAKKFGKWTFGASPKLLFGKTNINTKQTSLKLYTDTAYYAITATSNMNIQMSGIPDSNDNKNGTGPSGSDYVFNTKNKGLAIDLGVKYELNDKINISAGLNNLGYIRWNSEVHNYTANHASFTFDGLQAQDYFHGDSSFVSFDKLSDSVKGLINFDKNSDAYTTYLPYNFFAMGTYQMGKHTFGVQVSGEHFNKTLLVATTLCYKIKLGDHFTGALSYTARSHSAFNFGGALIAQFLHMQWYVSTDNWWAAVMPLDSKNMNLNLGMNLVFGKKIKGDGYSGSTTNRKQTEAEQKLAETPKDADRGKDPAPAPAKDNKNKPVQGGIKPTF